MEVISTYEELHHFNVVGSPFSIPKAALVLAGFHPDFSEEKFESLQKQLEAFGAGIEVTLLAGCRTCRIGTRHKLYPGIYSAWSGQRFLWIELG